MNTEQQFSNSTCEDEMHAAERDLAAFIGTVMELFGPKQARLSAEDGLDELELMDSPPRSKGRNWRTVMIGASARLATRVTGAFHHPISLGTSTTDTKVSPIPSSNCSLPTTLVS